MNERQINKDAATGRIVSGKDAAARPGQTYEQTVTHVRQLKSSLGDLLAIIEIYVEGGMMTEAEHEAVRRAEALLD